MTKPLKKGHKKKGKKKKKDKVNADSPFTQQELDNLFARLSTKTPSRVPSIVSDIAKKVGEAEAARVGQELTNIHKLIHERGVPITGFKFILSADDEPTLKVDMSEEAIRYLCQLEDSEESTSSKFPAPTIPYLDVGSASPSLSPKQTFSSASPSGNVGDAKAMSIAEKEKGNDMYQKRQFAKAVEHYSQAIALDPENMVFYMNRAAAYHEMAAFYKCVVDCWHAIEIGGDIPNYAKLLSKAWYRLGQARFKLQYLPECIDAYRKSVELNPSSETCTAAINAIRKAEALVLTTPDFKSLQTTPDSQRRTFVPPLASSLKAQVCVHCKVMLGEPRTPCPCCGLLLYCSSEHQRLDWPSHHSLCADLRMYVDDEFGEHGPVVIALSDQYRKTNLLDWEGYFRARCVRVGGCTDRSRRMLSDSVTYPLTIVYALQTLKIPPPKGRPLFIAVLGAAEVEEQLEPGHWGEISLFDPQINYCIYLVGPELSQTKHQQSLKVSDKIALWYWKDHYHNFRSHQFTHGSGITRAGTIDPDLFIMCNSGVGKQAADWMPTLTSILHSSTPAVFTTFTDDELRRDVKLLRTMNAKLALEPVINPFASLRTRLNPVTMNIMRRSNMFMFGVKGFDGEVPKDISNLGASPEFVRQWDTLMNRKRDVLIHLPMSLVGPFLKAPKTGLPLLWKEFEKDHQWFLKFTELNKNLHDAKVAKAQYVSLTSSIDGLDKSFFIPISTWDVPCYNCGDKGMLCCSRCKLLWYCTVDCRRKLNPYHRHICDAVKTMTPEQSDLLVLEDVSQNMDVMNLLREKVPKYMSSLVTSTNV